MFRNFSYFKLYNILLWKAQLAKTYKTYGYYCIYILYSLKINSTSFENWLLHRSYYIPIFIFRRIYLRILLLNAIYENVEALIGPIRDIEQHKKQNVNEMPKLNRF